MKIIIDKKIQVIYAAQFTFLSYKIFKILQYLHRKKCNFLN